MLNIGCFFDHLFMLIFATVAALALTSAALVLVIAASILPRTLPTPD